MGRWLYGVYIQCDIIAHCTRLYASLWAMNAYLKWKRWMDQWLCCFHHSCCSEIECQHDAHTAIVRRLITIVFCDNVVSTHTSMIICSNYNDRTFSRIVVDRRSQKIVCSCGCYWWSECMQHYRQSFDRLMKLNRGRNEKQWTRIFAIAMLWENPDQTFLRARTREP